MRTNFATTAARFAGAVVICSAATAGAQSSVVRVIGNDSLPIPYATVFVQGGAPSVTDA